MWSGLGDGTGNLTGRADTLPASGRAVFSQQRRLRVMLPNVTGAPAACVEQFGSRGISRSLPGDGEQ